MRPLYFGDPARPLFGVIHAPAQARDLGVVLCATWGREEVSSHLAVREWATQLAAAGWPTIRFDYLGEGESAGSALADGSLQGWVDSACAAADALKAHTGVRRLCFLGLRVGVVVASLAARGRADLAGLIAVAPVVKGRGYIRELTALQAAMNAHGAQPPEDLFQSGGFVMNLGLRDALSAQDLAQIELPPTARVLIIDRDDMPANAAWPKALQDAGAHVSQRACPGYTAMMADPHHAQAPEAMIQASLGWLSGEFAGDAVRVEMPTLAGQASEGLLAEVHMPWPEASGGALSEQVMGFPDALSVATVTSPLPGQPASGLAVLLLNAGSTRRIGVSRMMVDAARRWAAQGHVVMRLDLPGLGDSGCYPGRAPMMSYPHEAMRDIKAALTRLQAWPGVRRIHAAGLCAGAYHALQAARCGMPVNAVTLINPLIYSHAEGLELKEGEQAEVVVLGTAARYQRSALSAEKWLKLLKGQVSLGPVLSVVWRKVGMTLRARATRLAHATNWPLKDDLGTDLRRLARAGVGIHFVFAQGDPGQDLLKHEAGRILDVLASKGCLSLDIIDGADHVFTDVGLRRQLEARLDALVAGGR